MNRKNSLKEKSIWWKPYIKENMQAIGKVIIYEGKFNFLKFRINK